MTAKIKRRQVQVVNQARSSLFSPGEISLITDLILRKARPDIGWIIRIVLLDDHQITTYNRRFFKKNNPTDVISFSMDEGFTDCLEGELYISLETAIRQAHEFGVTPMEEVLRLTAHGLYHLLGYEDATEPDRALMSRLEDEALDAHRKFGVR